MAHRLDAVVSRLEDNNERFAQVLQKLDTTRPTSVVPADTSVRDTSAQGSRPMTTDPKPLYDAASADFTSGRYEQARTGFQSYVTQFATTELAGNAQYWIGETYYQQKQYPEALSAYRKVLDQYPHNIKVPAALLKQGMTQVLLGQKSDARDSFKKLVRDYPGTEQDAEARRQLKKMR
jgi:tol-pal system protein YbgF